MKYTLIIDSDKAATDTLEVYAQSSVSRGNTSIPMELPYNDINLGHSQKAESEFYRDLPRTKIVIVDGGVATPLDIFEGKRIADPYGDELLSGRQTNATWLLMAAENLMRPHHRNALNIYQNVAAFAPNFISSHFEYQTAEGLFTITPLPIMDDTLKDNTISSTIVINKTQNTFERIDKTKCFAANAFDSVTHESTLLLEQSNGKLLQLPLEAQEALINGFKKNGLKNGNLTFSYDAKKYTVKPILDILAKHRITQDGAVRQELFINTNLSYKGPAYSALKIDKGFLLNTISALKKLFNRTTQAISNFITKLFNFFATRPNASDPATTEKTRSGAKTFTSVSLDTRSEQPSMPRSASFITPRVSKNYTPARDSLSENPMTPSLKASSSVPTISWEAMLREIESTHGTMDITDTKEPDAVFILPKFKESAKTVPPEPPVIITPLDNLGLLRQLLPYAEKAYAEENVNFLISVAQLKAACQTYDLNPSARNRAILKDLETSIVSNYLNPGSREEINIIDASKKTLLKNIQQTDTSITSGNAYKTYENLFKAAVNDVKALIETNEFYKSFKRNNTENISHASTNKPFKRK